MPISTPSRRPFSRLRRWFSRPKPRSTAFFLVSASIGAFIVSFPWLALLGTIGYGVGRLVRFSDSWHLAESTSAAAALPETASASGGEPSPANEQPAIESIVDEDEYLLLIDDEECLEVAEPSRPHGA